jgi:hypothetical protein
MARDTVRIDELRLRVPGLSAAQARVLATNIAQRVADGLPSDGPARRLGALHLRVPAAPGSSHAGLEQAVTGSIVKGLTP